MWQLTWVSDGEQVVVPAQEALEQLAPSPGRWRVSYVVYDRCEVVTLRCAKRLEARTTAAAVRADKRCGSVQVYQVA